jgi:hypothetical protein
MMKKTLVAAATVAVFLTACGGGDDDETPPPTQSVPADVSTSSSSFISYLRSLIASAADMLEPVDVSMVTPATDNAAEPTPID